MQYRPGATIPIVYLITDVTDTTTYFVQAVIRDTTKNTVLSRVNLTQDSNNTRRFFSTTQSPSDVSGLGLFIDITTTVYTDSGYTTKSTLYQEQINTYLVWDFIAPRFAAGGGGVDYVKLRKIIQEEIGNIPEYEPTVVDLKPVLEGIGAIGGVVSKSHTSGIKNVLKSLENVHSTIKSLPPPIEPKDVDFSDILSKFDEFSTNINERISVIEDAYKGVNNIKTKYDVIDRNVSTMIKDFKKEISSEIDSKLAHLNDIKFNLNVVHPEKTEKTKKADYSALYS